MATNSSNQLVLFNSSSQLSVSEKEWGLLSLILAVAPPFPPLLLSYLQNFFPNLQHLVNHFYVARASFAAEFDQESVTSTLNSLALKYVGRSMADCAMPIREEIVSNVLSTYLGKRKREEYGWKHNKEESEGAIVLTLKKVRGINEVCFRAFGDCEHVYRSLDWRNMNSNLPINDISRNLLESTKVIEFGWSVSCSRGTVEEPIDSSKIIESEALGKPDLDAVSNNANAVSDSFFAEGSIKKSKKEQVAISFKVTKDEDEIKLSLWDELFGVVPDSEDSKKSSVRLDCLVDESNYLANDLPTASSSQVINMPAKRDRRNRASETVKDSTRRALFQPLDTRGSLIDKENILTSKLGCKTEVSNKTKLKPEKDKDPAMVHVDNKVSKLPVFESFILEEEEGSGGYATVYKARRKQDGATVAIKCPYINAHRNNVHNEIRMLERFGGKNFVIKYETSLKCKKLDCLVLEYVEHDKPEILKKEIDVFQLRWYGYCLFRALASLHKQGIIHRDVKPGNFLFSRKINKGYLIDFNLAVDLHLKYGIANKPKSESKWGHEAKQDTLSRNARKKNPIPFKGLDTGGWKSIKNPGADGSVITSVQDTTSVRTQSTERRREPLPCHGRKELINLLHDSLRSPNLKSAAPLSLRKRVAAPPGRLDWKMISPSPMPLNGSALPDSKLTREGPCAGTKGFRAPEVLLRSMHQGTKIDVWSAGVTLLYLITGRTPFYGDPEQNLKDIANFKGSEDLWEVSKLHNRESAFPTELYNRQYRSSTSLLEWCKVNSRRREFMKQIPSSLIDLVDKCLTINPRLRISAEDALKHDFFAQCHPRLDKHS